MKHSIMENILHTFTIGTQDISGFNAAFLEN